MANLLLESHARPRLGDNADKAGSYELAFVVHNAVISPGDTVKIQQFITGYGEISLAKLMFYPPHGIFDEDKSTVHHGLRYENGQLTFGNQSDKIAGNPVANVLTGILLTHEKWGDSTLFVDSSTQAVKGEQPIILTETIIQRAPFEYELVTKQDIKPGKYALDFHFTYFNGSEWKAGSKKVEFQVQNWFERNESLVKTLGLVLAVGGILNLVASALSRIFSLSF